MAARKRRLKKENMSIKKYFFSQISVVVSILLLTTIQPLAAESASDDKRIEELERTVAELKKEVAELKKKVSGARECLKCCCYIFNHRCSFLVTALVREPPVAA
jgi:hypothetical protein